MAGGWHNNGRALYIAIEFTKNFLMFPVMLTEVALELLVIPVTIPIKSGLFKFAFVVKRSSTAKEV